MAAVTVTSYRRVLNTVWRPEIGKQLFHRVRYSSLVKIADGKPWSKKTYTVSKITYVPTGPPKSPSLSPTSSLAIPLFQRGLLSTRHRCTPASTPEYAIQD